jgi:hypothetical protein
VVDASGSYCTSTWGKECLWALRRSRTDHREAPVEMREMSICGTREVVRVT